MPLIQSLRPDLSHCNQQIPLNLTLNCSNFLLYSPFGTTITPPWEVLAASDVSAPASLYIPLVSTLERYDTPYWSRSYTFYYSILLEGCSCGMPLVLYLPYDTCILHMSGITCGKRVQHIIHFIIRHKRHGLIYIGNYAVWHHLLICIPVFPIPVNNYNT